MKPVKKAMFVTKANILAVQEAAWAKAQLMDRFGYAEISHSMKISIEQATKIVRGWQKERAIEQVQGGNGLRSYWRCVPDFVRIEPLRIRTPEENMWLTMRRLRSFSPSDVAGHSTTETVQVSVQDAADYCRALLAADYLDVARKAVPTSNREAIYRLTTETGPQAPLVKRVRALVDANIGATIVLGGGA
jgi:hypothetical protein